MPKRKVKAKPINRDDHQWIQSHNAEGALCLECLKCGMKFRGPDGSLLPIGCVGSRENGPMSAERLEHLRRFSATRFPFANELIAEIDRLRAEVAAKDAEIAKLKYVESPSEAEERRAAEMQPNYFGEPFKAKRKSAKRKST